MTSVRAIKQILEKGKKIRLNGLKGLSRKEVANAIGVRQLTQMDVATTRTMDIACWMLGTLNKSALEQHLELASVLIGANYTPGCMDSEHFDQLADKTRLSPNVKALVKRVLVDGLETLKLTDEGVKYSQLEIVRQGCQTINLLHNRFTPSSAEQVRNFERKMSGRLKKIRPDFMIQVLIQCSANRIESMKNGKAVLTPPESALLNLATLIPEAELAKMEEAVADILTEIETFRYERYVQIRKLFPLIYEDEKLPLWFKIFDHDARAQFPPLDQLAKTYELLKPLFEKKADEIRKEFYKRAEEGKRIGIFDMAKTHKMVIKGVSINNAHKRVQPETDLSIFKRSYQAWLDKWAYTPYWESSQ
ncbi:MAG: hypothetical protein IE914_06415 [Thiotrichales bacterium]|nr:hypothetical protein [Thiotrichales bacterium]